MSERLPVRSILTGSVLACAFILWVEKTERLGARVSRTTHFPPLNPEFYDDHD